MKQKGRTVPKIHTFESTGMAYDMSQCSDEIHDGDILSVPNERAVAVLIEAWPTAISENSGEFHALGDAETFDWAAVRTTESNYTETRDYSESFKLAVEELDRICWEAQEKKWNEQDFSGFNAYPLERRERGE
jgi:hypothetical protein